MLTLKATQKCRLSIVGKDSEGNPAPVENPVFSVSDPSVGELTDFSEDGQSCTLLAGTPGSGQVNFSADGIIGEGESPLNGVLDVTILPGDAVLLELNTGAVEDQ